MPRHPKLLVVASSSTRGDTVETMIPSTLIIASAWNGKVGVTGYSSHRCTLWKLMNLNS